MPEYSYEPFCPPIQRLGRSYRLIKAGALLTVLAWTFWVFEGRALCRRMLFGPVSVPVSQRTGEGFVAVCFPRITEDVRRLTLRASDLSEVLAGLRRWGWVSVSLSEVEDFYRLGKPLPAKAVLLAFERDEAGSIELADAALKEARMRGLVFLNKLPPESRTKGEREALSPHAVRQMVKSGAWDVGWVSEKEPRWRRGDPVRPAVLDLGENAHAWTRNPYRYPLRFLASRAGYNDAARAPWALRIRRLRSDKSPAEILKGLAGAMPRVKPFSDRFQVTGLGADWVAERGVVVSVGGRLVLVPTPKQKAASAYLAGTERWRDGVVEWDLRKYRRNAWVYARSSEKEDRWIRLGVRGGHWYLQQKTGPGKKPVTLARAPMTIATTLPAHARLVLKGPWAIVHVNGRMQFGKAVRVHSGVDRGRVELDVYDPRPAAALAVLDSFSASPLAPRWIGVSREAPSADPRVEEALAEALRERAVFASALSPRWLEVLADGRIVPSEENLEFARSLAGYYRCAFVPMVDFASPRAGMPRDRGQADRMVDTIMHALRGSEAVGVNVRLDARAGGEHSVYLLASLRRRLHETRRRLYVTPAGTARGGAWSGRADGVLETVESPMPGALVLKEGNS